MGMAGNPPGTVLVLMEPWPMVLIPCNLCVSWLRERDGLLYSHQDKAHFFLSTSNGAGGDEENQL